MQLLTTALVAAAALSPHAAARSTRLPSLRGDLTGDSAPSRQLLDAVEEEPDQLVIVLEDVPSLSIPPEAPAMPPMMPTAVPPAEPPMVPAPMPAVMPAAAPMPAVMMPAAAPDMPVMPPMGVDMDAVALLMEFDGECGDVGMPCCVLAMVTGGGSIGACITGSCATIGEAVCEDVDCEEAGGTESVGICLSLVEGAMVMPEDGGSGPMPAAAAPMPAVAPPMPAVAAPMPAA